MSLPSAGTAAAVFGSQITGGCTNGNGSPIGGANGNSGCDPSINEIDMTVSNTTGSPVFSTTLYVSAQPWTAATYKSTSTLGVANYDNTGTACACTPGQVNQGPASCPNLPQAWANGGGGRFGAWGPGVGQGLPAHLSGGNMSCPIMNNNLLTTPATPLVYHNYKLVRLALLPTRMR